MRRFKNKRGRIIQFDAVMVIEVRLDKEIQKTMYFSSHRAAYEALDKLALDMEEKGWEFCGGEE